MNEKKKPIRSPGEFPKDGEHGRYQRHFTQDGELEWSWDNNITDKNPRSFNGSFILLSDKNPTELFNYCRVDLRNQVKGVYKLKPIQELYTVTGQVILGMHANCDPGAVTHDFRSKLTKVEQELLERKKEYEEGAVGGFYEAAFDEAREEWFNTSFPELLGYRGYPKGGPYEKSERGVDTSWKLAVHFEYAVKDEERILAAIGEFKRKGWMARLFGDQALLVDVIQDPDDAAGKATFATLIPKHQNINRSVGNIFLPGVIDMDTEIPLFFEPYEVGKIRTPKFMSLRDVVKKVYVKIGGHKIAVFQYCFRTRNGTYQAWFWDKVPEIREFVEQYGANLAAYLWHRCLHWGWDEHSLKRLFQSSFDSDTAVSAMNSKWNACKQKVIEVAVGSEAAAMLKFGSSPFVLQAGQTTLPAKKKPKITSSDLEPDQKGGIDVDDLNSVGGQSNAETVFQNRVSDDDDAMDEDTEDDVSAMGDDEGFEDEDDDDVSTKAGFDDDASMEEEEASAGDDESTKSGWRKKAPSSGSESEPEDGIPSDSESTKANLDELKTRGRKVREEADDNDDVGSVLRKFREEKEALQKMYQDQMEQMRKEFENKFKAMSGGVEEKGPGATGGDTNSGVGSKGSASAAGG